MSKKFNLKVVFILIIIIGLTLIVYPKLNKKKNVSVFENHKESSNYAIYLQDVSGNYSISNSNTFPTSGYILNVSKTECYDFNNSKVSDIPITQELNGKITLTSDKTVYCNLYFTKDDNKPVINNFTITGKAASNKVLSNKFAYTQDINVTYDLSWNDEDVAYYCITSGDSASCNWVEAANTKSVTVSTPALDNSEGNKTMKAYLKDKAQNISEPVSKNIFLDLKDPTVSNVTYVSKDTSSITVTVTGSDGTTGSGVVKYECSAKEKGVWFTQDGDTCKVTGLNDGTEYTIEGRVTDTSGRVSTNSVSTTQSTEAAYSCSAGEELVQDAEKGSSSGGYICKASASSKGWYNTTTYYTCSNTGSTRYSNNSAASEACSKKTGTCSYVGSNELYWVLPSGVYGDARKIPAFRSVSEAKRWMTKEGVTVSYAGAETVSDDYCTLTWNGEDYKIVTYHGMCTPEGIWGPNHTGGWECTSDKDIPIRVLEEDCKSSCLVEAGTVSSGRETSNFHCDSGWSTYSGSGSSLECYRPATKG